MEVRTMKSYFIITLLVFESFAKRDFLIKITNIKCRSQSHTINITCTETKSNRIGGLNIHLGLTDDVYKMRYNVDVRLLNKDKQWESFLKFTNLDVCEFLSGSFTVPILLIARSIIKKVSNFPDRCPIKKETAYYVQQMKFDPELFPPYLPEAQFSANGIFYDDNIVFLDYQIGINIVSKMNPGSSGKHKNGKA